jgi:hypothetical protein
MSSGSCKRLISRTLIAVATVAALSVSARPAAADPPTRIARISLVTGAVSFRPATTDEWDAAALNYPLTIGDHLWTDRNARAEVEIGTAVVRLNAQTEMSILNLDDRTIQLRLTAGTADVHLRDGWSDAFELDTPNGAVSLLQPGTYRVDLNANGDSSTVTVRRGDASVFAGGYSYPVHAQESVEIDGIDSPHTQLRDAMSIDTFEDWCLTRDRREDTAASARYIPEDVVGYSDLDDYGAWTSTPEYGAVWTPRVQAGWVPYRDGRWVWIDPWGWTWVDAEPWGFAPFHYGRWVSLRGSWAWVPGRFVARPVYAPALVAFVGDGGWSASLSLGAEPVGWFPLGPREAYVPAYRASSGYLHAINVSQVNLVTPIDTARVAYVNRNVPGAITVVPRDVFVRSRPVAAVAVSVPRERVANVAVVGHTAPVAAQSIVRETRPRVSAPPPTVVNRGVVMRRRPPQPAPAAAPAERRPPAPQQPQRQEQPRQAEPQQQPAARGQQPERGQQPQRAQQPERGQQPARGQQPQPRQQPQRERPTSRRDPDKK